MSVCSVWCFRFGGGRFIPVVRTLNGEMETLYFATKKISVAMGILSL